MFKESYEVTYETERYITLAVTNVNNKEYALVNHIVKDTDSDVDNIYYIFTIDDKQNMVLAHFLWDYNYPYYLVSANIQ